jgi:hypothetical protein
MGEVVNWKVFSDAAVAARPAGRTMSSKAFTAGERGGVSQVARALSRLMSHKR